MKKSMIQLLLGVLLAVSLISGCGKKTSEDKKPKSESSEDAVSNTDEEISEKDPLIQYVPNVDHLSYDEQLERVFVNNVLLFQPSMTGARPKELLGGKYVGYDLFSKSYIYEFQSPKSYSELEIVATQVRDDSSISGSVEIMEFGYWSYDATADSAIAEVRQQILDNPVYKYGIYIPESKHVQTNPEGQIRYLDNAICVSASGLDSEQQLTDLLGGTISGYHNDWYVITFDDAKSLSELKDLCDLASTLNVDIPASYDDDYNYNPGKQVSVNADLFFVDPFLAQWTDIQLAE